MKSQKSVLVVGGSGFLGFHLCKFFLKKKFKVLSLSLGRPSKLRKIKKVKYYYGDISNFSKIKFLKPLEIDYVINCGGYVDHYNKMKTYKSHVQGCKNLFRIFSKKSIEIFIQLGSSSEYGLNQSPHRENIKEKPKGTYGKYKLMATKFLSNFKDSFPFVIVRPYQVYGPFQDNNRLIPFIINSCLKDKKFPCTPGKQKRDFLFVEDFTNFIYKCINNKRCLGEILNIGFGKPIEIKKVIEKIRKKINSGHPEFGKIAIRKDEQKKVFPSIKKASKFINWKPKVSFDKGLNITIKYYKKLNN